MLAGNTTLTGMVCAAQDRRARQRVIKTTQSITGTHLTSIRDTGEKRYLRRAQRPCCRLAQDTEDDVPPDFRAASSDKFPLGD